MRQIYLFRLVMLVVIAFSAKAQIGSEDPPTTDYNNIKMPESPNVSSFTKYGNTTVNTAVGIPNIEIPIYTFEIDGVSIPISISYNATGVKVSQLSGVVGLNWTLNTGGAISRTIRSRPDEYLGWYNDEYSYLDNDWYDSYPVNNPQLAELWQRQMIGSLGDYDSGKVKKNDHNPDWFSYSFLGHSGHFIMLPGNTAGDIMKENRDEITFDVMDLYNFELNNRSYAVNAQDQKGNHFVFGINERSNNRSSVIRNSSNNPDIYSYEGSDQHNFPITAWMLSKIVTKNDKTINFSYRSVNPQYRLENVDTRITLVKSCQRGTPYGASFEHTNIDYNYTTQLIERIWSPDGNIEVLFEYETDRNASHWKEKLTKITINSLLDGKKKEFLFEYSTFRGDPRLKLDTVKERVYKNGSPWDKPPFVFTYRGNSMPNKNSFSQDFYGYYNGKAANSLVHNSAYINSAFSLHHIQERLSGKLGDRRLHIENVKNGILEKIQYPTGGRTEFKYEPNAINEKYCGGLRISEIRDIDEIEGVYNKKSYKYSDLVGDGLTINIHKTYKTHENGFIDFSSGPVAVPGEMNNPYSAGYFYKEVTVITSNGREQFKDRFRYEPFFSFHKYDYRLIEEIKYKGDDPVWQKEWTYGHITPPDDFSWNVLGLYICFITGNNSEDRGYGYGSKVQFRGNYAYLPTRIATTELFGANRTNGITTIQFFEYNEESLLKTKEITDTRFSRRDFNDYIISDELGEVITTNFQYPWSTGINLPNLPPSLPISKEVSSRRHGGKIDGKFFQYDRNGNIMTTFHYNKGQGTSSSPDYVPRDYEQISSFLFENGKPVQVLENNGNPTSYIWGYNNQFPVAKIEGKLRRELNNRLVRQIEIETNTNILQGLLNNLRNDQTTVNAMVTTFTYDPLYGVTTITDPKGEVSSYEYDEFGRLSIIRDPNGYILSESRYKYSRE